MRISDLRARRGESILPKWNALMEWIESAKVIRGAGVRITETPDGTYVYADNRTNLWRHPFSAVVSGLLVQFEPGVINASISPKIKNADDGNERPIDGVEEGEFKGFPKLRLKKKDEGSSFLVVLAKLGADRRIESATIEEVDELDPLLVEGGSEDIDGIGMHPLARLDWKAGVVSRVFDITHHNLGHRFIPANESTPHRHLFWAT